jgi:hypothetical protein
VFGGLAVVCCLALSSCGGEAKLHLVQGQVFFGAEPAVGAFVVLHLVDAPEGEDAPRPNGIVKEDGSFTLSTPYRGEGAPVGEYAVAIVWYGKNSEPDARTGERKNLLPEEYSTASSPLRVQIKEGTNTLDPFRIPR